MLTLLFYSVLLQQTTAFPVAIICVKRTQVHASAQCNVRLVLSTKGKRHAENQKIKSCRYICGVFQS